ncbi:MAG: hypothetical protein WAL85_02765 [Candidatus Korobacteraceae bacterium]
MTASTNSNNSGPPSLKRKAIHEAVELAWVFAYLAFFFCALETYSTLLLREFHVRYLSYAFALLNALIIAKVILLGEYAHVGRRYEGRPLLLSAIYKAFLFSLLVFGFHFAEEAIKGLLHGVSMARTFHEIRIDDLLGRSIVIFCVFIPLFAFREFRRVLGEDRFYNLLFRSRET